MSNNYGTFNFPEYNYSDYTSSNSTSTDKSNDGNSGSNITDWNSLKSYYFEHPKTDNNKSN